MKATLQCSEPTLDNPQGIEIRDAYRDLNEQE